MEEGQGARKSNKTSEKERTRKSKEITSTPACVVKGTGAVTPGDQPINKREQQSSKKKSEDQKRTMDQYFGGEKGSSRRPKGGPRSNQSFSGTLQRLRSAQEKQTTPSNLSSLQTG